MPDDYKLDFQGRVVDTDGAGRVVLMFRNPSGESSLSMAPAEAMAIASRLEATAVKAIEEARAKAKKP